MVALHNDSLYNVYLHCYEDSLKGQFKQKIFFVIIYWHPHSSKYTFLCSADERNSSLKQLKEEAVNNKWWQNLILGWTIPLTTATLLKTQVTPFALLFLVSYTP